MGGITYKLPIPRFGSSTGTDSFSEDARQSSGRACCGKGLQKAHLLLLALSTWLNMSSLRLQSPAAAVVQPYGCTHSLWHLGTGESTVIRSPRRRRPTSQSLV